MQKAFCKTMDHWAEYFGKNKTIKLRKDITPKMDAKVEDIETIARYGGQ